jgi:hypothetical protein
MLIASVNNFPQSRRSILGAISIAIFVVALTVAAIPLLICWNAHASHYSPAIAIAVHRAITWMMRLVPAFLTGAWALSGSNSETAIVALPAWACFSIALHCCRPTLYRSDMHCCDDSIHPRS